MTTALLTPARIRQRVAELGDWFHNLNLGGVQTAPNHFLGDYPAVKWQRLADAIPQDPSGRSVLEFARHTPALGICQWFHFEDHRLDPAIRWLKDPGVRHVRTGLSWADSLRPGAEAWFDRQMRALGPFDVTLTFCFTPEAAGLWPHHSSPPRDVGGFADFCAAQVRRYA